MRWSHWMLLGAWLSGCSFLVQFDPETQPCDSANLCNPGYFCSDAGLCQDAGVGGADAGEPDASTCTAREINCGDGLDNDCDGDTDCVDTDCGGVGCSDGDPCTSGELCAGGSCPRGNAVLCNTPPNPCQSPTGTCEAATGRCLYTPLADGTSCGAGLAARCCMGTCINTTINGANCGGCGLACATGQACQPIDQTTCGEPPNTSGRCTCGGTAPCPSGQFCGGNGTCRPTAVTQCAPGQILGGDGGITCGAYCRY